MKLNLLLFPFCVALATSLCASIAQACPLIGGFVDYNCDQQHKIVFIGDSIVRGIGDERYDGNGGYPVRLGNSYPSSTVVNLGQPGFSTKRLLRLVTKRIKNEPTSELRAAAANADIVVIGVGTNDFWEGNDPALTVRNIKRIVKLVRNELAKDLGVAPLMAVTKLTPTTRGFQRDFVNSINALLDHFKSTALPVRLYFDVLPVNAISFDGLHPNSKGYDSMARIARKFIEGYAQQISAKSRLDLDGDGVYDRFEKSLFGTNPGLLDSDGDGINDGEEIFTFQTDPLNFFSTPVSAPPGAE